MNYVMGLLVFIFQTSSFVLGALQFYAGFKGLYLFLGIIGLLLALVICISLDNSLLIAIFSFVYAIKVWGVHWAISLPLLLNPPSFF